MSNNKSVLECTNQLLEESANWKMSYHLGKMDLIEEARRRQSSGKERRVIRGSVARKKRLPKRTPQSRLRKLDNDYRKKKYSIMNPLKRKNRRR